MTDSRAVIRVMLVDDHLMFTELLGEVLSRHDDIVITGVVTNGDDAVERTRQDAPDVIVLDYRLPGDDGVAVARSIHATAPDVGLIMLSGVADDAVLRAALLAGCTGFVTKDRAAEDVVDAVRAVHDGRGAIDPAATARLATMQVERPSGAAGGLTEREHEVLVLLTEGATTRDIAERLYISVNTARNHVQRLITKLGAHSRLEAVAAARRAGLLEAVSR